MVSPPRRSRHHYSYEEYLAYERDSGMKHEYEDGEIVAMAGGSRRHNALASRISAALENTRGGHIPRIRDYENARVLVECAEAGCLFLLSDTHGPRVVRAGEEVCAAAATASASGLRIGRAIWG